MKRRHTGFSLVEMSMVLMIIAVFAGAIFLGRELIMGAKIRATIGQYEYFLSAVNNFEVKYDALPGDMSNAVRYWGAAAGSTADGLDLTCIDYAVASVGAETCNGNGNGLIDRYDAAGPPYNYSESFRFWQHLNNAGFLDQHFSGVVGPASNTDHVVDWNSPGSAYPASGWSVYGDDRDYANYVLIFDGRQGNKFELRGREDESFYGVMSPMDAYTIDKKLDDGLPGTGQVRTYKRGAWQPDCISTNDASTSVYEVSHTEPECALLFLNQF